MSEYSILYDERVWSEDLKKVDKPQQKKIFKAIQKKLSNNPEEFGKSLSGELKGLFFLRIGEYRVIYSIHKKEIQVLVIKIGFRRNMEVYMQTAKRLNIF